MGEAEDYLNRILETALNEDLGLAGDITSQAIMPENLIGQAAIIARQSGLIAGLFVVEAVFQKLDPDIVFETTVEDGDVVEPNQVVARIDGNLLSILSCERIALNFLSHMSGIATRARVYVDLAARHGAIIKDTRKTLPGLRPLEKYAVLVGGGQNHRFGLYDAVLIKENHIKAAGGVSKAIECVRANLAEGLPIEIEVEDLDQVKKALDAGVETILLDNMDNDLISKAVKLIDGRAEVEVSGGVTLDNVEDKAAAGPDFISVGAITQSTEAFDFSLLVT